MYTVRYTRIFMSEILTSVAWLQQYSYLGIFLALVTVGFVIPFPEEIIVLMVGYLMAMGVVHPLWAWLVTVLTIMLIDNTLYWLGRTRHHHRLNRQHNQKITRWLQKIVHQRQGRLVFVARFMALARVVGPLVSGQLGYSYRRFWAINALAVVIFVSLYTGLSWAWPGLFLGLVAGLLAARWYLLGILGLGLGYRLWSTIDKKA